MSAANVESDGAHLSRALSVPGPEEIQTHPQTVRHEAGWW